ncbi:hypothetical protein Hesp01_09030 [Herbidospora sp. NBRC 101105]|nr:hypothetical protein Hesp01_09030 [Herbidospora sp. NBRC 101105]
MASSVFHVGRALDINLAEADLGHPEIPGLWDELLTERNRPVPDRAFKVTEVHPSRLHRQAGSSVGSSTDS